MGQAKDRGTFEERKRAALERQAQEEAEADAQSLKARVGHPDYSEEYSDWHGWASSRSRSMARMAGLVALAGDLEALGDRKMGGHRG